MDLKAPLISSPDHHIKNSKYTGHTHLCYSMKEVSKPPSSLLAPVDGVEPPTEVSGCGKGVGEGTG